MITPKIRLVLLIVVAIVWVLNGCNPFIPETWFD